MNENFNKPEDRWGIPADQYPSTDELLSEDSKKFLKTFETCHDALMDKVNEMAKLLIIAEGEFPELLKKIETQINKKDIRHLLRHINQLDVIDEYKPRSRNWNKKKRDGLKTQAWDKSSKRIKRAWDDVNKSLGRSHWEKKHYVGLKKRGIQYNDEANNLRGMVNAGKLDYETWQKKREEADFLLDEHQQKWIRRIDDKSGKQRVENRVAARGLKKKNNEL